MVNNSQDLNSVLLQAHHDYLKTRSRFNILGATFSKETISFEIGVSKLNTRLDLRLVNKNHRDLTQKS